MIIVGIDYSITSPGICVHTGEAWSFDSCEFYFFNKKKHSPQLQHSSITNLFCIDYYTDQIGCQTDLERFTFLSNTVCNIIDNVSLRHKEMGSPLIFIEGYSFGSSGSRTFQIAENTGILKYRLASKTVSESDIVSVPPSVIKKFATTKGNANKEMMEQAFIKETGVSFRDILEQSPKQYNPSSDIIDAYYICKYGFESMMQQCLCR